VSRPDRDDSLPLVGASTVEVLGQVAVEAEHLDREAVISVQQVLPVSKETLREAAAVSLPVSVDMVDGQERALRFATASAPAPVLGENLVLEPVLVRPDFLGRHARIGCAPRRLIKATPCPMLIRLVALRSLQSACRAIGVRALARLMLAATTKARRFRLVVIANLSRLSRLVLPSLPIGGATGYPISVVRTARIAGSTALGDRLMASPTGLR
jgi:hypothetical protein